MQECAESAVCGSSLRPGGVVIVVRVTVIVVAISLVAVVWMVWSAIAVGFTFLVLPIILAEGVLLTAADVVCRELTGEGTDDPPGPEAVQPWRSRGVADRPGQGAVSAT